ncbi:MAG: transcription antitermination factor NusB [Verrucomicrobia bacterium]|nr:MAG: transcription antitermination factor NusB [Verrucomicrobiota bacterium]
MSRKTQRRHSRIAAMQFLYSWSLNPSEDLEADLQQFFADKDRPRDYYAFAEQLIHGTIENLDVIDEKIRSLAENWDFDRIARVDLAILRLAIFEMLFRKDIPPVVSINEAIDLSKTFSSADSRRFINGILDRVKDQLDRPARSAIDD